ncbi:amidohydrolase family protein [Gemmobacter serpentinus]|uniref:amidohydrolase family protein n=1 Tax=Gemmobacter serpentinus TaxID=2652247 RepID=UPI00124EDDDE|nr:amidohydrolase family protein [Gemmobacter serpentinus]
MKIIDMRCRPAYLHDFFGKTPGGADYEVVKWLNGRVGTRGDVEHFTRSATPDGFLAEVSEAGLTRAVVVGRHTPTQHLPNDVIHQITSTSPLLEGIGSVDIVGQGRQTALDEAERAILTLGLKGIDVEPGFGNPFRHADDPVFFPLYDLLQGLNVPLCLMSGPTTPDPRYNDPAPVANVARLFPRLRIAAYHGFWPNVAGIIGVAFRHENVFLIPDMYLFQPGSQLYIEAANSFLGDQLLFGSSYPFRPIRQSVEDLQALGLRDAVLEKVLHDNAAHLLGL